MNGITTGMHRNGWHYARALGIEGVGQTPADALEDLQSKLFEHASEMEELASSIIVVREDA